jgi:phage terminase large subunit
MFNEETHVFSEHPVYESYQVSCDYGTVNPASFGLWGKSEDKWHRIKEYYYSSKSAGISRTDEEHYAALEELTEGLDIESVTVDPSAASFIECIRRHGKYTVIPAKNDVLSGIRRVGDALKQSRILFHESCKDTIREFYLYSWSEKSGTDIPIKENDHAMDDIRYFVSTLMSAPTQDGFFVASLAR